MRAVLLQVYGPFAIQGYGFFIALGVALCFYLLSNDSKLKAITPHNKLLTCFQIGFIAAILGGRFLYFLNHQERFNSVLDFFSLWEGGLSVLGAISLTIFCLVLYLKKNKIQALPFFDRVGLYAPLMQAFGRLGCFMSGCCYGQPTSHSWGITYSDMYSKAPLHIAIHPTQIYSSLLLFSVFFFLYFYLQRKQVKPGTIFLSYLSMISAVRFSVDFLRWDREFFPYLKIFSISQILAILIFVCGMTGLLTIFFSKKNHGSI
jgi:phosphatidylglycerol---prolipoprotein diacylglyceryl transferase